MMKDCTLHRTEMRRFPFRVDLWSGRVSPIGCCHSHPALVLNRSGQFIQGVRVSDIDFPG